MSAKRTPEKPVPVPRAKKARPSRRLRGPAAGGVVVLAAVGAVVAFAVAAAGPERVPSAARPDRPAPSFAELDAVTGRPVASAALRGRNVLLFFSEGVMCQACFEQIQALQLRSEELVRRRLVLVNVTTDPPETLRQAAAAYGITTALVSDEDRDMSRAYDVLGRGMHPDTAGHTFVLVDREGRIRWRRDYEEMFVPPDDLLAAIPDVSL